MGFSIGRFLGAIAPAVGSIFGPLGTAVGLGAQAALAPDAPAAAATVGRATQPGPISAPAAPNISFGGGLSFAQSTAPSVQTAGLGGQILRQLPGIGLGVGAQALLGNGNGKKGPIQRILEQARAATGGPVTRNKIIDAAKVCGLETAAQTFGLDIRQVCMVVVRGRTRRRRGVSAADIRRTKRTIGFASKIRKDLKALAR